VQVARDSCLAQFLIKELHQTSFTEMSKRGQYYATVMHVARLLCVPELAAVLAARPTAGSSEPNGTTGSNESTRDSVAAVLDRAAAQARISRPAWKSIQTHLLALVSGSQKSLSQWLDSKHRSSRTWRSSSNSSCLCPCHSVGRAIEVI